MTFPQALSAAKTGKWIRREVWTSVVSYSGGNLHFLLPAKLSRQLGTAYMPTKTDKAARDWMVST